jgi:hypothetical protein
MTPTDPQPIEIVTPYLDSELSEISFAQSADVLYIVHKDHPPRKLSRFSAQGFFLEDVDFQDGPYLAEDESGVTMNPSATTGQVTITASSAVFIGTDVGRHIRLKHGSDWGYAKIDAVNPIQFTDADIAAYDFVAFDVTPGNDRISNHTHGMDTGELVRFLDDAGGLPGGINAGQDYYVYAVSATVLEFYNSRADALAGPAGPGIVNITSTGAGRITSSVIDIVAHGFTGGEGPVTISTTGALPAGLSTTKTYFYGFVDANSLTLSESRGGPIVGIDDNQGGGTHSLNGGGPSPTCTATVKKDFGASGNADAWRMSAWGFASTLGFPRTVSFHEQRLWFTSNPGAPQTLYGSASADFEHFLPTETDGTIDDGNAIVYALASNQVNVIEWLIPSRTLVLGASNANWTVQAAIAGEAITPTNIQIRQSSGRGSSGIIPVLVDDRVVYVSQTGLKVFTLGYSFETDAYAAEDLTLLAEHITASGITDMDFAPEPWSAIWCVRADGELITLTLIREQEIAGWGRHILGGDFVESYSDVFTVSGVDIAENTITFNSTSMETGDACRFITNGTLPAPLVINKRYYVNKTGVDTLAFYLTQGDAEEDRNRISLSTVGAGTGQAGEASPAVVESVAIIPAPSGDASLVGRENQPHDQVWALVKRTINGETKRYVEFLEDFYDTDDSLVDAFFVDGGITVNSQSFITELTGLTHLAGETVDLIADGVVRTEQVVSLTGTLTLANAAKKTHLGLRYNSDFESLRLNIPAPDGRGTSQMNQKRIDHIVLRLVDSLGGQFGPDVDDLTDLDLLSDELLMDELPELYNDDIEVPFDGEYETYGEMVVRQHLPLPFTLVAILPRVQVGGRGDRR